MSLPLIDTHEFTRRADVAEGHAPVATLERLGSLLATADGALDWRLAGRSELGPDGSRRAFLRLEADGEVRMQCVRCLEPVAVRLGIDRDYRLVATEEQAEREDAEDDEVDLLVASRRFDLAGLLEDEAIMALPPAPSHDDCSAPPIDVPVPAGASGAARGSVPPSRGNPFAALAALREEGTPPGDPSAGEAAAPDAPDGPSEGPTGPRRAGR